MNTLDNLKEIARGATQEKWVTRKGVLYDEDLIELENGGTMFRSTSYGKNQDDAKHIATFNPQTVLALLELLEMYRESRRAFGNTEMLDEKEAALIAKLEDALK